MAIGPGAVRRIELGGLPCWQVAPDQAPWSEELAAGLIFRSGVVDESRGTRGVNHIVEHLAVHAVGERRHPYNGWVDRAFTGFVARGSRAEVVDYLRGCAAALRALDGDRLAGERRVLRSEQSGGAGAEGRLLRVRYGDAGFGLAVTLERALDWMEIDAIQAWADKRFTAANAALWIVGEPPDGLDLGLPPGVRIDCPDDGSETVVPGFPAYVADGSGGAMVSMIVPRTMASVAAAGALSERVQRAVRREAALGYAPSSSYQPLSAARAHLTVGSDCDDHDAPAVLELLWSTVGRLADEGPGAEELAENAAVARRRLGEPQYVAYLAEEELLGSVEDGVSLLAQAEALTAPDVAAVVGTAMRETAILLGVDGSPPPFAGLAPVRIDATPIEGAAEYIHLGQVDSREPNHPVLNEVNDIRRLIIGSEGLTLTRKHGPATTIRAPDVVGGCWWPDETLTVWALDGTAIDVRPPEYRKGDEVEAAVRALIGPQRLVPCFDAARTEAVRDAARAFDAAHRPTLRGLLTELPFTLHDGELPTVVVMSAADVAAEPLGLLVATPERVMWLSETAEGFELPLDRLAAVSTGRLLKAGARRLRLEDRDGQEWALRVATKRAEPARELIETLLAQRPRPE